MIGQEQRQRNQLKMEQVPCVEHHHDDYLLCPIWFLLNTKGHLWFMWQMWQVKVNWPNYENDPKSRGLFLRQLKSFLRTYNQQHRCNDLVKIYDLYFQLILYKIKKTHLIHEKFKSWCWKKSSWICCKYSCCMGACGILVQRITCITRNSILWINKINCINIDCKC